MSEPTPDLGSNPSSVGGVHPTLPFDAVVALPGQDETTDGALPSLEDGPTRAEGAVGTLPYGAVLGAPDGGGSGLAEAKTQPPPDGWIPGPAPARGAAPERFERGATLDGFVLSELLREDPSGAEWLAAHPQYGPCEVVTLARELSARAGPQLLLSVRLCMAAESAALEQPLACGAEPGPWVAWRREVAPTLATLDAQTSPRALKWARDLSNGLAALHAQRVALGDPRPARAKVPAVGPARWAQVGLSGSSPPPAAQLSPERRAGGPADEASDVFAFAETLERLAALAESSQDKRALRRLARACAQQAPSARPSALQLCERLKAHELRTRPDLGWAAWLVVGATLGALIRHLLG